MTGAERFIEERGNGFAERLAKHLIRQSRNCDGSVCNLYEVEEYDPQDPSTLKLEALVNAIREFQRRNRLRADGIPGKITQRWLEAERFCGVVDTQQSATSRCRWDHVIEANGWDPARKEFTKRDPRPIELRWWLEDDRFLQQVIHCVESIEAVCAIKYVQVDDPENANLVWRFGRIDGLGKTLAWHHLPCGKDGPNHQLGKSSGEPSGLFDRDENWGLRIGPPENGRTSFVGTGKHEFLHGVGLPHLSPTSLMGPYDTGQWQIDPETEGELVIRYGPRIETTKPPVPSEMGHMEFTLPSGVKYAGDVPQVSL